MCIWNCEFTFKLMRLESLFEGDLMLSRIPLGLVLDEDRKYGESKTWMSLYIGKLLTCVFTEMLIHAW
jgi:hypothetical protein